MLGPSWHQNPKNGDIKWMSKKHKILSQRWFGGGPGSRPLRILQIPLVRELQGRSRSPETLHFVPQGHGGGYIYISNCPSGHPRHRALGCGAAANPPRKQQKPRNLCVHGPYDDDGDTDDDDHHHDW